MNSPPPATHTRALGARALCFTFNLRRTTSKFSARPTQPCMPTGITALYILQFLVGLASCWGRSNKGEVRMYCYSCRLLPAFDALVAPAMRILWMRLFRLTASDTTQNGQARARGARTARRAVAHGQHPHPESATRRIVCLCTHPGLVPTTPAPLSAHIPAHRANGLLTDGTCCKVPSNPTMATSTRSLQRRRHATATSESTSSTTMPQPTS